ncbi:MAG: hypothetical protein EBZ59_00515 [Planctomycetia bacterium]|nr:hypothetical protein [Planctomycetia bacterium]
MRLFPRCRPLLAFLLIIALVPTSGGCGGATKKKGRKGGPTVKELKDNAKKETADDRKAAAWLRVARAQLKSGDKSGAKESAKTAYESVKGEGEANVFAPRLVDAAAFLAEVEDKKTARDALKKATDLAEAIEDPIRRARVLADAGGVYGDKTKGVGDAKVAKEILAKASEVAEGVEERFRAEALAAVALGYTRGGLGEAASDMVGKLEEAAKALEEPRAKAEALAAAANVKAQIGKKDEAAELLSEAGAAAKSVQRMESKAYALLAVAVATTANGDHKKAVALLKEAEKAADKVAEPDAQKTIVDKVRATLSEVEKKAG